MSTQDDDFSAALKEPAATTRTGLVVGLSPQARLARAMRDANQDAPDSGISAPPGARWSYMSSGVPNPYGTGLDAFEPNNVLINSYRQAKAEIDAKDAAAAATSATSASATIDAAVLPAQAADGRVASFVNAALQLAQRRVPYVWGGTTANGVDCSGLIYFAARAAGIQLNGADWPRLRAIDYGQLGTAVALGDARPGDLAYFDNPGTSTDHVGIYIGNGQIIQAPQSGDVVKVTSIGHPTSIRRIFTDTGFGQLALPTGQPITSYNGRAYSPGQSIGGPNQAPAPGSTITRVLLPTAGGVGRARAI